MPRVPREAPSLGRPDEQRRLHSLHTLALRTLLGADSCPRQAGPICREDLTMWIRRHDAEGEAPEDSDESFSGEDDESVRRSMPLCGDGFGNIAIRYLLDIQTLVGIDGGLVLNRILEHSDPCDMFPGPPYEHEIFVNVGSSGIPITISDVSRALMSIPHDVWQRGRSYYWEGVVLSPDRRRAHFRWGS